MLTRAANRQDRRRENCLFMHRRVLMIPYESLLSVSIVKYKQSQRHDMVTWLRMSQGQENLTGGQS